MEAARKGSFHWVPKFSGSEIWAMPVSAENVTGKAIVGCWAWGCMAAAGAKGKFPVRPLGMEWAYGASTGVGAGPG